MYEGGGGPESNTCKGRSYVHLVMTHLRKRVKLSDGDLVLFKYLASFYSICIFHISGI